jgi:exopolyphosphatase/guanosine-5'-triphosphate,3'-diphosphate pyrophosphatase
VSRRPGAAIDLGSTSVHLLIARPDRSGLVVLDDESTFLGLGAAVDGPGELGSAGRATLASTVGGYVDRARDVGVIEPIVMGTEPLRRLSDATRIVADVSARTGVPLTVLEHEEEALLTLVGLTAGRAVRNDLLVVDIGGGSSELVEIGPERLARAAGIRLGAGRLTRQVVDRDPPTDAHFASLNKAAGDAFDWSPSRPPAEVVFVGGTATNLLKLLRRASDPGRDDRLDRAALETARRIVASGPAELLAATYGLREARIRLLAAGAAIIEAVLDRMAVPSGRVVDTGIREGAIIAADRAGSGWRERLDELAHGWIA